MQTQTKVTTAAAAAERIPDGATIALTGSGGGLLEADAVFAAVEARFLASGHPAGLTLVHALGIGDRDRKGTNRFAHRGMLRRVIGGHWGWSPRLQALARDNAIEAYSLPAGAISTLLREIGAARPGLITPIGLGTFVDPRLGGGRINAAAQEDLVEVLKIDGRDYLRYRPFNVDVGIIRGTYADARGNISMADEPANLDAYAVALAAHNCGGMVIAQVRETVPSGALAPRSVQIPGVLVNAIVVDPAQMQTRETVCEPAFVSRTAPIPVRPPAAGAGTGDLAKRIIARRAAMELRSGATLNFGYGASAMIATMLSERGELDRYWTTVEQGIHGGVMRDDDLFGTAYHPEAIIDSTSQFDFYSGGGLDLAFLGMAEMDCEGNVNVSHVNGVINGPGGFIEITPTAEEVVFCGTFDAKGSRLECSNGTLRVTAPGQVKKLVDRVSHITFSGRQAQARGQKVVYITERAAFALRPDGVELIEVAPGIDIQRDVLDRMDFTPIVRNVGRYPAEVLA